MLHQEVQKSSSRNPSSEADRSRFAPRPVTVQAQEHSHKAPTQQEMANEAFGQSKVEASRLQLKEKSGAITSEEQERLGVLQAGMDDFWAQKLENAARFGYNFANISVHSPDIQVSAPIQPQVAPIQAKSTVGQSNDKVEQQPDRVAQPAAQMPALVEQRPNQTGLPGALKSGVEQLAGLSLDGVKVHYNSAKPAQLDALAYAQGSDIHVAPGQERHLAHEAWHVVQQAQGRVKPTMQMKGGVPVNDDENLEREADWRGIRVARDAKEVKHSNGCGCQSCLTLQAARTTQARSRAHLTTAKAFMPIRPAGILTASNGPSKSGQSAQLGNSSDSAVVQRYCGAPGCNDPNCHDEANHGFDKIYPLRGRTVYHGNVGAGDIGTGTGTNQTTRNYVNSIPYPEQVSIEYNSGGPHGTGGRSEFVNQPLAPGQRADAGHVFGRQYGGSGSQTAAVFPQHPQTNRGNSYNGAPTRDLWRAHEDNVRGSAQQGQTVSNSVTIRDTQRIPYYCKNPQCGRPLNGSRSCPHCGWTM